MKNCKTFYETQRASHLQEIIQSSSKPTPIRENVTMSFEKKFSYGYIQKYTDICSSWASINGAVQMLSLTPSRTMSAGKCLKSERLLALLQEHIIFNVK